jgi:hypothetical protein
MAWRAFRCLATMLCAGVSSPAEAQEVPVDLELALAAGP